MTTTARETLAAWPNCRPVALLILGDNDSAATKDEWLKRLPDDDKVTDWWVMAVENHMVEPPPEAGARPHHWAVLVQFGGGAAARSAFESIRTRDASGELSIFLARPLLGGALRIISLMRLVLNRMPLKSLPAESVVDPEWLGGANPTANNIAIAASLPQHEPIVVLNLHRYKRRAKDPETGEESSGKRIASVYLKQAFQTFMRSGGHVSWTGGNLGQLHGPAAPRWQEFALIWYPGRDAFNNLSRHPACARTIPYRKAGMDIASVAHTRIMGSSRREDVRA